MVMLSRGMHPPPWLKSTPLLISISAILHLVLLIYANHVDTHPERYGGLKYTDVDWRVVLDGARLIFNTTSKNWAEGWLSRALNLPIGDPYRRATFRYTPLLPLLLSPSLLHPLAGKLVLAAISLSAPLILLHRPFAASLKSKTQSEEALFWPVHLLWTLNPFVLNITTRGSPEAIIVALVVALLACLELSDVAAKQQRRWDDRAAVVLALAISYKVYPVIYVPAIWTFLARKHGWFGAGVWRFGIIAGGTLLGINGILWSIWGWPFLEHTFLYHLTRLDHRHNFSPYFYPIYLSLYPSTTSSTLFGRPIPDLLLRALRHPLTSFLPQTSLVLAAGFLLPEVAGLAMTFFVQTVIFVVFNKVVTSQYFMWWIPLLAASIPRIHMTGRRAMILLGAWVAGQAVWLGSAYQLEFLAKEVHVYVWMAGIALFGASIWILGELIDAYRPPARRKA